MTARNSHLAATAIEGPIALGCRAGTDGASAPIKVANWSGGTAEHSGVARFRLASTVPTLEHREPYF